MKLGKHNFVITCGLVFLIAGTCLALAVKTGNKDLFARLENSDPNVRIQAAKELLAEFPSHDLKSVLPMVVHATRDKVAEVRFYAVEALLKFGMSSETNAMALSGVVPALLRCFNDSDPRVRAAAAGAVAQIMPVPPESVVQPLLVLLQDTDNEVRKAAIEALAATQEHRSNDGSQKPEIRDALLRLIKDDPSPGV